MKLEIGNKVYYFTEQMLKDSNGNIPEAVERAYFNGKAVKITVHSFKWEPETKTRELIIYAPSAQVAGKFLTQMKTAANGGKAPKTAPAIWQEICNDEGTINVIIEKFYQIKGDWYNGTTATQIR